MKAVAALLLFQPNRSARDYRKLSSEYKDQIFLDKHDVRLYYVACYLHYRLEFLWRNQRIAPEWKFYRYYIMYAFARKLHSKGDILDRRRAEIERFVEALLDLARDETKLKKSVKAVAELLDKQIAELGLDNRERIRDAVRSDSFLLSFERDLQRNDIGVSAHRAA